MTPLDASISAITTFALLIIILPSSEIFTFKLSPPKASTDKPLERLVLNTFPSTTWFKSSVFSASVSLIIASNPSTAANASSVGANTVNAPGELSVSTNPAASAASRSVVNEPFALAISTMVLSASKDSTASMT